MKNILIIDDKNENLITCQAILDDNFSKCNIFKALSGKEGIEIAIKEQPDVIILDIVMPKMDGYSVTREIRKFNKDVIIIAQTAYDLSGDYEKAIAVGCNDYLSKPINANELKQMIKKYL
jgi:CheY-like chemotaxis protein